MSGQVLEEVKDAKYLGVTVSDDLEWTKHINAITTKANSKLSFLRRNLKGSPEKLDRLLRLEVCIPHSLWYTGTTCRMKKKLQITQNKVIRFILGLPSRSHIGVTEFSSACMLPVPLRVDQLKFNHMYNIVNGISPHYLRGEVSMAGNNGHNT